MTAARHLAAACLLGFLTLLVTADMRPADPLSGNACASCHVSSGAVEPETARVLHASQEKLCGDCHPRAAVASHPTGIRPSMQAAADYPLDWKGELTCSSCHDVHGDSHGRLRGDKRRREFCVSCHPASFFEQMADGGRSLAVSGHLDSIGLAGEPTLLDPYTAQCMDCHGERGDARVEVTSAANSRHSGSGVNHPVGVDYARASGFGGFRDPAALDRGIELPGGLVSCISCHSGYSGRHGEVRRTALGRSLCLECHDL